MDTRTIWRHEAHCPFRETQDGLDARNALLKAVNANERASRGQTLSTAPFSSSPTDEACRDLFNALNDDASHQVPSAVHENAAAAIDPEDINDQDVQFHQGMLQEDENPEDVQVHLDNTFVEEISDGKVTVYLLSHKLNAPVN